MSSPARIAMMNSVRSQFLKTFQKRVEEMISNHPFQKGECIVQEIAKAAATELGVGEGSVEMVPLHNHWKSAEFVHQVSTPMPPPPKKGMKREPPVITTTRFKVRAESAIIRAGYIGVDEDMTLMGNDVWVCRMQRPQPIDGNDSSSSS